MPRIIHRKKYQVIYADPPWPESDPVRDKRNRRRLANSYYKTMKAEEILGLADRIKLLTADCAALFLWTTPRHLPLAIETMEAWGFQFVVVGFTWMKKNVNNDQPFFGMGYYTRSNAEFCLMGRKGSLKPVDHSISSAVYEPRRKHSQKPDTVRERIERLFGDVPRLELFARERSKGWDVWGDQVSSDATVARIMAGA